MTTAISISTEARHDGLVLGITAETAGNRLVDLGKEQGEFIRQRITEHGAVVLSGFDWQEWPELDTFVNAVVGRPLDYTERSSPRTELHPGVFTATDHPATEEIFLHTEQSYNLNVPRYLFFFCRQESPDGGASLLADCRALHAGLPRETAERFEREGYLLVRNFRPGLGLSWQEAFGTSDPDEVKAYCDANSIELEWLERNHLRTRQLRWAVSTHPETGVRSWFNHLTFFHARTLREDVADFLLEEYGPWGMPTNTFYADGSEIPDEVVRQLQAAYRAQQIDVNVHTGEVLIVDNISVAHGRAPFVPPRDLFVSMAGAHAWSELRPVERTSAPAVALPTSPQ
ncbi:TauD/TfdA family dioxygenase [Kitasatospora sp. NPDC088264]|uniref:TauD/TfdA family dioxygenase n=1 Tax=Kitasatospora sp. NPDC088264 TaxID=3155296 RepID=UPI00343CF4DC